MTKQTELRRMLEFASGFAEKRFAVTGEIRPMWHVVDGKGDHCALMQPDVDKDMAAALVRMILQEVKAVRCLFISEAWQLEAKTLEQAQVYLAQRRSLEHHPDRFESVVFQGEDVNGETIGAHRRILRDSDPARLGPLVIDDIRMSQGRFVGMLPVQGRAH